MNPNECPVVPSTLKQGATVEEKMVYLGNLQKYASCRLESIRQQLISLQGEINAEAPEAAKQIRQLVSAQEGIPSQFTLLTELMALETRKVMRETFSDRYDYDFLSQTLKGN